MRTVAASPRRARSDAGERPRRDGVDVLGRLVEHQHVEAREEGPRERDALTLAAAEPRTARAHLGLERAREPAHPAVEVDGREDVQQLVVGRLASTDAQVLCDRRVEDVAVLARETDDRAHVVAVEPLHRRAVELDGPALDVEEPDEHRGDRRLARAARADDRDALAGTDLEVDATQRGLDSAGVRRPDPARRQHVGTVGQRRGLVRLVHGVRRPEDRQDARRGLSDAPERLGGDGQPDDELEGRERDQGDDGEVRRREPPRGDRGDPDDE